jgi:hypothetical protein
MLRERTRCTKCGTRGGVTIQTPSWRGEGVGWAPFPVELLNR